MITPRYVAKRVGNDYVLVRVDTPELATRLGLAAAGVLLLGWGARRNGLTGVAATLAGAAITYRGWTGENPLDLLPKIRDRLMGMRSKETSSSGPSYPHNVPGRSKQMPEDHVDEAAMESFPASDPPASHRSTSQPPADAAPEAAAGKTESEGTEVTGTR